MKKNIFTFILLMTSAGAFAQFSQGTKMIGGVAGFGVTTQKYKDGNTTVSVGTSSYFSLEPQFGYFIIDRLAIGAGLDLNLSSFKYKNDDDKESSTSLAFTPFVRYYLPNKIFFFGETGFGVSKEKATDGNETYESKRNIFSWGLGAGYAIMLNESVAIEPMVGYGGTSYKNPDNDARAVYPGLYAQIGIQVYLP